MTSAAASATAGAPPPSSRRRVTPGDDTSGRADADLPGGLAVGAPGGARGSGDALVVDSLAKRYGDVVAARGVSFTARAGAVTAVLGPNGAGKTTTVECVAGLRRPDAGSVRVLGLDARDPGVRARVGVMLQDGGMPAGAPALAVLRHVASLHEEPLDVGALAAALGVDAFAATTVRRLSGGQRQRLALCCAVVGRPELVLLDEPSAGVDLAGRAAVWALLAGLRDAGVAVVLTTHSMEEVEALADTVVLLADGAVAASGTVAELTGGGQDRLTFGAPAGLDLRPLRDALPTSVEAGEVRPGWYEVVPRTGGAIDPQVLATVTSWCAARAVMPRDLQVGRRSLADVVLELSGEDPPAPGAGRTGRRRARRGRR